MWGWPVLWWIDRDPIEPGAQVRFHLLHQIAGGGAQIGQIQSILSRDDETELVAILAAPVEEGAAVLDVALGRIDLHSARRGRKRIRVLGARRFR